MKEKILGLLEYQSYSFKYLMDKLNLTENELKYEIKKLIDEKLIYLNVNNKYSTIKNGHLVGIVETNSKGEKFVRDGKDKIFIKPEHLHTALKNDLVVLEIFENCLGSVLGILERKNNKLVCEIIRKDKKLTVTPFNVGCELEISLSNKHLLDNLVEGDRVIVYLTNNAQEDNTVVVNELKRFSHKDDPRSDELAIAISKDFDIDFSIESLQETENIPNEILESDKTNRTDLTNENIFTIDSISTKDMDDAVSIKKLYNGNYLLGVHIADVAHYVLPKTSLYKEAYRRGTSLYLGDSVIPMLPHKLSNGICSLNEGVDRLTKSCFMEVSPSGKVVNFKIIDSVINSKKKMTYEELNKLFNGEFVDSSYAPFIYDLELMRELSNILTNAKNKRGNIEFASNEIKVHNNEDEIPVLFSSRTTDEAERLIENFMILANETVATYFYWNNFPFIYRVHNIPDDIKLEKTFELIETLGPKLVSIQNSYGQKTLQNILKKYKGTPEYSIISNLLLRNMNKAQYSTENIGHYALALDYYCHFTSPIRRFPDLVVHHLLNIFNKDYSLNNLSKLEKKLTEISKHSSYKERQAIDAERDYLNLKMAKYMESHIGEYFEGTIIDIERDTVTIKLDNNIKGTLAFTDEFCNAFNINMHTKQLVSKYSNTTAKLGSRVTIKVHDVNIPFKEVYFELIDIHKDLTRKLIK